MSRLAPPLPLRPARFHPPSSDRRKRGPRAITALAVLAALATAVIAPSDVAHAASRPHVSTGQPTSRGHCPWIAQARTGAVGPGALAGEVLSHMTLTQKADYLSLATHGPVENANQALPALCLPSVSLSDGPNGLGNGLTGVTQFPAAIGVAATFDPAIARAIGRTEALEARAKGIMAVQGPELNLARVPLSGRIFEAYGEDPYLTSVMGVADVLGMGYAIPFGKFPQRIPAFYGVLPSGPRIASSWSRSHHRCSHRSACWQIQHIPNVQNIWISNVRICCN